MSGSEENRKERLVFGRDVSKIPCYRSSFLTGIGGGFVSGLGYFMFTSNVRRTANVAVLGYFSATVAAWTLCRYRWNQSHGDEQLIKDTLETKLLMEGTELERIIESQSKEV